MRLHLRFFLIICFSIAIERRQVVSASAKQKLFLEETEFWSRFERDGVGSLLLTNESDTQIPHPIHSPTSMPSRALSPFPIPTPLPTETPTLSNKPSFSASPSYSYEPTLTKNPTSSFHPSTSFRPSDSSAPSVSAAPTLSPIPTFTQNPSVSGQPSSSAAPASSIAPSYSSAPTVSQSPTITSSPSLSMKPSYSAAPTHSKAPTFSPFPTATSSPSFSVKPSYSAAPTYSKAPTCSPHPTVTLSPTTSVRPSGSAAPTNSRAPTFSPHPTVTLSPTTSVRPSGSAAPTNSKAPTFSPFPTATSSPSFSVKPSYSAAPTYSKAPTFSPHPTVTLSPTTSVRPSRSAAPTNSRAPTFSPFPTVTSSPTSSVISFLSPSYENAEPSSNDCTIHADVTCISEENGACDFFNPAGEQCLGRNAQELRFIYMAKSLCGGNNTQSSFLCVDEIIKDEVRPSSVYVKAFGGNSIFYEGIINEGNVFSIYVSNDSNSMNMEIRDLTDNFNAGRLLQTMTMSIQCRQEDNLNLLDTFGGLQLVGYRNEDKGLRSIYTDITIQYTAKNIGSRNLFLTSAVKNTPMTGAQSLLYGTEKILCAPEETEVFFEILSINLAAIGDGLGLDFSLYIQGEDTASNEVCEDLDSYTLETIGQ